MELWLEVRSLVSELTDLLRLRLPCGTEAPLNTQTVACPVGNVLVQPIDWLLEQMSHCAIICYDMGLRATFKVTPPMLYCFAPAKSFKSYAK
jgi:hypothetical protein